MWVQERHARWKAQTCPMATCPQGALGGGNEICYAKMRTGFSKQKILWKRVVMGTCGEFWEIPDASLQQPGQDQPVHPHSLSLQAPLHQGSQGSAPPCGLGGLTWLSLLWAALLSWKLSLVIWGLDIPSLTSSWPCWLSEPWTCCKALYARLETLRSCSVTFMFSLRLLLLW